jgi:4'-phosphopantetheinyl transferase
MDLTIGEDEIHVWLSTTAGPLDELEHLLAPDERDRAERYRFLSDMRMFVVRRGLLRLLLGRYLDEDPTKVRFGYTAYGKPYLPDSAALVFNLSYSDGAVAYAVTLGRHVGIDVEWIRTNLHHLALADRYFSSAERTVLRALSHDQMVSTFFRYWTRKEALVKAAGHGLSSPLLELDVRSSTIQSLHPAPTPDKPHDSPESCRLESLAIKPGLAAAVAATGIPWSVRVRELRELLPLLSGHDRTERSRTMS